MKILMLETGGWGGICHYTYNLSQALSRKDGIEIALFTDTGYELDSFPRDFKLIKAPLKGSSYLKAVSNLAGAISKFRPDIVHVQSIISARRDWILFILARLLGLKVIVTAHNILPHEDFEKRAFFMKSAFKVIYLCASKIITHSEYSKERLVMLFHVTAGKVEVIDHGNYLFARDREIPQEEARKRLKIPLDKKVLLSFGALRPYKGLDGLLEAFARMRRLHDNAFLAIVGPPLNTDISPYKKFIEESGIAEHVFFKADYVPFKEIPLYFFASDAVVFPYKEIDASGSLQLAYAFSKPVIVNKVGGFPEAVEDGSNGILVDPGNVGALREAMEKILFDAGLARKMGERSLKLALGRFSWETIAEKTAALYRAVYKNG